MRKPIKLIAASLLLPLLLSACSMWPLDTVENLMRPPRPEDPNVRAILAVLRETYGQAELRQPREGGNAVVFAETGDAAAAYFISGADKQPGLASFTKDRSDWRLAQSMPIEGDALSLAFLDGNVLLCRREDGRRLFTIHDAALQALCESEYDILALADITGDGYYELVYAVAGSHAGAYKYDAETRDYAFIGSVPLDPGAFALFPAATVPSATAATPCCSTA